MSYPRGRNGRRAGITSHKNSGGTQGHQGSRTRPFPPTRGIAFWDQKRCRSGWPLCHHTSTTWPTMLDPSTGPQYRLSHESARLSPSM